MLWTMERSEDGRMVFEALIRKTESAAGAGQVKKYKNR